MLTHAGVHLLPGGRQLLPEAGSITGGAHVLCSRRHRSSGLLLRARCYQVRTLGQYAMLLHESLLCFCTHSVTSGSNNGATVQQLQMCNLCLCRVRTLSATPSTQRRVSQQSEQQTKGDNGHLLC